MSDKDVEIDILIRKNEALKNEIEELKVKNEKLLELLSLTTDYLLEEFSAKGE